MCENIFVVYSFGLRSDFVSFCESNSERFRKYEIDTNIYRATYCSMKILFEILYQRVRIADTRITERVTFSVTDWGSFGDTKSYWTASVKYNKKRIEKILCE